MKFSSKIEICLKLAVIILFVSCQTKSNTSDRIASDPYFPKGSKCSQGPQYRIKMKDAQNANLEELVDNNKPVSITTLNVPENRYLLGEITKHWDFGGSTIFVADMNIAHKVYGFTRNGEMKFVISNTGSGPGQFNYLWDVQLNLHKKVIEIWDLTQHKLLSFDIEGQFVEQQIIKKEIVNFFPVTKDWYIYHLDGRDHMGSKNNLLLYSDITGEKVINEGAPEYGIVDAKVNKLEFSEYQGSVYYHRPMTDTIYWIGPVNGQICADYVIDFDGKGIPEEAKKQTDLLKAGKIIEKAGSSSTVGNLVVGTTYLHFMWTSEKTLLNYYQFVDRHKHFSYQVKENNLEIFGIKLSKILSVNMQKFSGYSYLYNVDQNKLKEAIANENLPLETRENLKKILAIEDNEMPFLIQFNLTHSKSADYE